MYHLREHLPELSVISTRMYDCPCMQRAKTQNCPASLIERACRTYGGRPSLGIPRENLVPDDQLPRLSSRTVLADTAFEGKSKDIMEAMA